MTTAKSLAFVSVAFEAEFSLLQLQARSMAFYLPESLVSEIIVIDNSRHGIPESLRTRLVTEYGDLARFIRFLRPEDICKMPGTTGWRSQQVLKLCVSSLICSERYVVLDAKNIFISTPSLGFFEAPDGRPRANSYSYRTHPLRPALDHVLRYLGLDPAAYLDRFPATITPFVLETSTVRELVSGIEQRSGTTFGTEFVNQELTEFFLYSGWIAASGHSLDDVYDFHQVSCPNVWPHSANLKGVLAAVDQASVSDPPLFTVHRKALGHLDRESADVLAHFWVSRSLFPSTEAAADFVRDFQRAFARAERNRRIRDLPHKLRRTAHDLRRRMPMRQEKC